MPDRPADGVARLTLPADWHTVDLLSDLHLSPALPRTAAAWCRMLARTEADALILLGDVFEVWIGDDVPADAFERQCIDALAHARCPVLWMAGNRDFLFGPRSQAEAGVQGLPDPVVVTGPGNEPLLLTHGDELCRADTPYQQFRQQVRSAAWQSRFLALPRDERQALAAAIRQESRARARGAVAYDDLDAGAAREWLQAAGCRWMVHGHTHQPGRTTWHHGTGRDVLSDWDLDDDRAPRAELLRWTAEGLRRLPVR